MYNNCIMHTGMYVLTYLYIYIYIYLHTPVHTTYIRVDIHLYIYIYICAFLRVCKGDGDILLSLGAGRNMFCCIHELLDLFTSSTFEFNVNYIQHTHSDVCRLHLFDIYIYI